MGLYTDYVELYSQALIRRMIESQTPKRRKMKWTLGLHGCLSGLGLPTKKFGNTHCCYSSFLVKRGFRVRLRHIQGFTASDLRVTGRVFGLCVTLGEAFKG